MKNHDLIFAEKNCLKLPTLGQVEVQQLTEIVVLQFVLQVVPLPRFQNSQTEALN